MERTMAKTVLCDLSPSLNLNLNDFVEVPRSLVLYDVGGLR